MKPKRRYHPPSDSIRYTINYTRVLHREDGPALIESDGSTFWYRYGLCHRVGAPAIEISNGRKEWFLYGKRHREDGPAVIDAYGNKRWFLNNVWFWTKEDWFEALTSEKQQVALFSKDFME